MKRGWSEAAAIGLAANAVQESGATTSPKPGDGGTSHGLFQWNKERIVAFRAMNGGKLPSETSLDTQLDFADKELRGTERRAGDALAGAETPEDAARIASTQFLRPKDTANEETRRAGIATTIAGRGGRVAYTAPGGDTAPDFSAMLKRVVDSDKSPAVKAAALSDLKERHSTWVGTTATERATITRQFDDIKAALMAGKDDTAVPEAEIRRLFPKPQADDMIGEAIVARGAGQAFKGVQWGTPEEIDATRADLASGTGYTATLIRLRRKRASGGGAEQGMDAVGDADTPDQIKMRLQMVGIFNKLVNEREAALKADPRGYVSQAPTVQAAIAAAQGAYAAADNNPDERGGANAARQMVLDATLTAQAMLGVPEWERRILSNAEVARDVGVITRMKPEEGDIGVQINQLVEGYGAHGNKMFGELVHNGNLPKEYMVLAHVTAPDQVVVRNELQRGLATIATMGGMEKYRALLKPEDAKTIDDDLGKRLAEFRATTYWNDDGGKELYANIKSAAQIVAYGYAYRGISATTASKDAVNGILSQYEFSGSKRVPKGQLDEVTKVTEHIQETLTPADLAPSGGNELLKPEDRTAAVALALRRGSWVPTKEGDGLTLMIPLKDSRGVLSMRVAERIGGQPITIRFNNLPWVPARPTLQGDPMGINPQW